MCKSPYKMHGKPIDINLDEKWIGWVQIPRCNYPLRNYHLMSLGVISIVTWKSYEDRCSSLFYYVSVLRSECLHMLQSKQHISKDQRQ